MIKERYFTESSDRTHTLLAQVKTKAGKWIDYEKFYAQGGFDQKDYIFHWLMINAKVNFGKSENHTDVRILNAMRKQVYANGSHGINMIFGGWGSNGFMDEANCSAVPHLFNFKIVSIRFTHNPELADVLITDLDTTEGFEKFARFLQDISMRNDGIKSVHNVAKTVEDNFLNWYKVKFNSGIQISFALYK